MALRWGFTEGAYNKFCHYFSQELPIIIKTSTPISTASHLRDVLKYAHDHSLRGKELYGNVIVSPQENGTIEIRAKGQGVRALLPILPTHNIFDLIIMLSSEEGIPEGYKAHVSDGIVAVEGLLVGFPQYSINHLHSDVMEFRRKGEEL